MAENRDYDPSCHGLLAGSPIGRGARDPARGGRETKHSELTRESMPRSKRAARIETRIGTRVNQGFTESVVEDAAPRTE